MSEINDKVLAIYEGRKEALERITDTKKRIQRKVECYVSIILDVFEASNYAKESTDLVWGMGLSMNGTILEAKICFDEKEAGNIYSAKYLLENDLTSDRKHEKLKEAIKKLNQSEIPVTMIRSISEYFVNNFEEYFEVKSTLGYITIKMKRPSICEK